MRGIDDNLAFLLIPEKLLPPITEPASGSDRVQGAFPQLRGISIAAQAAA